jgi:WD40 repeat protein
MNTFNNENLLKLIFNTFRLFKAFHLLKSINNKILCVIMIDSLSYNKVFSSMGSDKIILDEDKEKKNIILASLPDGNIITGSYRVAYKVWDVNNYSCIKSLNEEGIMYPLYNGNIAILDYAKINILNSSDNFKVINTISTEGYRNPQNFLLLPNGNLAFSAKCDFETNIIILDSRTGYSLQKVIPFGMLILCEMINLAGNKFAACGFQTIHIWDIEHDYELLKVIHAHSEGLTSIIFTNNLLISGSFDNDIKIWDTLDDYKCIKVIKTHWDRLSCLLLLPNGFFAAGFYNGKIKIWDLKYFNCINILEGGHQDGVTSMLLLKDNRIVSNSSDKLIIWNY